MAKSSDHDESQDNKDDEPREEGEGAEEEAEPAPPPKRAGARRPAKPAARPAPPPPLKAQGGSLGKSMILFLIIIGGLAGAFAYFGRETGGAGGAPKWRVGDTVEVEISLVSSDIKDLACWSPEAVQGRHCAYESPTQGWSKGDADDANLLRPYTTTDRVQFLAAGVWSQPALSGGKLPASRFAIKCGYKVEGKLKRPGVRWSSEGAWLDRTEDWYAGTVTDCKLVNVAGR
ncbi:MAG: hypothetical protein IT372_13425 [Polyangiaceae bacterium]|nr:hypothetical protein [Polyangiaceae bacterium]